MPKTLIAAIASTMTIKREVDKSKPYLDIAEMFSQTIQGEGISVGVPSTFLRVKNCSLNCSWCDSSEVWRYGNRYSIEEILDLLHLNNTVNDLKNGHHLILTGGSPLLQQDNLYLLIDQFEDRFGFKPFIEVENECVIEPTLDFIDIVDQWNNSPKTSNSGMKQNIRYKPELVKRMSNLPNSWFKFVIEGEGDWEEVVADFILPRLINIDQVILMPVGSNQEQLKRTRETVVEIAIQNNVRFSDREHINIWDRKTGV